MMGIRLDEPFPLYPDGFPPEIVEPFETRRSAARSSATCRRRAPRSSRELGEEHLRTGEPDRLHERRLRVPDRDATRTSCRCRRSTSGAGSARRLLTGEHRVGRVIARPFEGPPGAFVRRPERRDFSVPPPGPTVLDALLASRRRRLRRRQDPGHLLRPGHHGGPCTRTRTTTASTSRSSTSGGPVAGVRLHEPRGLRLEVRAPQRPGRVRGGDRGVRPAPARADRRARRRRPVASPATTAATRRRRPTDHSRERTPLLAAGLPGGPYEIGTAGLVRGPRAHGRGSPGGGGRGSRSGEASPTGSGGDLTHARSESRVRLVDHDGVDEPSTSSEAGLTRRSARGGGAMTSSILARSWPPSATGRRSLPMRSRLRRGLHPRATSPTRSRPRS